MDESSPERRRWLDPVVAVAEGQIVRISWLGGASAGVLNVRFPADEAIGLFQPVAVTPEPAAVGADH